MKSLSHKCFITVISCFVFIQFLEAQHTCQTPEIINYISPDYFANNAFVTTNVPNDNATALPPFCNTSVGTGGQRWFSISLPNVAPINVSATTELNSNFDTKIHVYTGTCGSLVCVAGDDDSGIGTASLVNFTALPGQTYLIRVGGYMAAEGQTSLYINAGYQGCNDPEATNYNPQVNFDNGTCCYEDFYGTLTISDGGSQYSFGRLVVGNNEFPNTLPGETSAICGPADCNVYLFFNDAGLYSSGATYTLTLNGYVFSGQVPFGIYDGFSYVPIDLPFCGCTSPDAYTYNPNATLDDGSCQFAVTNVSCNDAMTLVPYEIFQVNTNGIDAYQGPYFNNCFLSQFSYALWYKFTYQGGAISLHVGSGNDDTVLLLMDACDGNPLICMDDTPLNQLSAQVTLSCADGLVKGQTYYFVVGLLGGAGIFNAMFSTNDFPGCIDPLASNYNSCASVDDGSCSFQTNNCPADFDNSGNVNVSDLLFFITFYGSSCPQ